MATEDLETFVRDPSKRRTLKAARLICSAESESLSQLQEMLKSQAGKGTPLLPAKTCLYSMTETYDDNILKKSLARALDQEKPEVLVILQGSVSSDLFMDHGRATRSLCKYLKSTKNCKLIFIVHAIPEAYKRWQKHTDKDLEDIFQPFHTKGVPVLIWKKQQNSPPLTDEHEVDINLCSDRIEWTAHVNEEPQLISQRIGSPKKAGCATWIAAFESIIILVLAFRAYYSPNIPLSQISKAAEDATEKFQVMETQSRSAAAWNRERAEQSSKLKEPIKQKIHCDKQMNASMNDVSRELRKMAESSARLVACIQQGQLLRQVQSNLSRQVYLLNRSKSQLLQCHRNADDQRAKSSSMIQTIKQHEKIIFNQTRELHHLKAQVAQKDQQSSETNAKLKVATQHIRSLIKGMNAQRKVAHEIQEQLENRSQCDMHEIERQRVFEQRYTKAEQLWKGISEKIANAVHDIRRITSNLPSTYPKQFT